MTEPLTPDQQRIQDVEIALGRARGHVTEVRRLVAQGAPAHAFTDYLDQLEADLNTIRPVHVGWSGYEAQSQPFVGNAPVEAQAAPAPEAGPEVVGEDGLTDSEREQVNPPAETAS